MTAGKLAVDNPGNLHNGLWKKIPRPSKEKTTFPHKFPLLLLLLHKPLIDIYILLIFKRKERDYAIYL